MGKYEMVLVTDAGVADTDRNGILGVAEKSVKKGGGSWGEITEWGQRTLAYEIADRHEGWYHIIKLECDGETLAETVRLLRITDGVLRVLAVDQVTPYPVDHTLHKNIRTDDDDDDRDSGRSRRDRGR